MAKPVDLRRSQRPAPVARVGYWAGLLAFLATVSYVLIQLLQLLRVFRYPVDEVLIYGASLCIVIPFVLAMLALHHVTAEEGRFWTHAALIFTAMYAVFVTANYVVQLATVIPFTMKGRGDEVRLLQQMPHSLFWDFDALGYIFMGIAMFAALPALPRIGPQRRVRVAFLTNALVTPLITFVYFYPNYSERLLILGFPWAITAPIAMLMLALMFREHLELSLPRTAEE
jgi:hypothetical protein